MSKRDRLGKGLGALLGEYQQPVATESNLTRALSIASIIPNPFQPRREFDEQELHDLAASIRENGLLQPIMVRPSPANQGKYELVAGERRWRAVTRLGWKDVPAIVREMDDRTLLVIALVENLQRQQLSALEEAEGFRRLGDEFGLSQQQIAEVVGRDRSTVANALRLLNLPVSVRQYLADGRLSAGHARALLGLVNDHRMSDLAKQAVEHNWSVRELEAQVQRTRPKKDTAPRAERARDAHERLLEEELQQQLGTAVKIRSGRGMKGKIEIPFYGAEDFERVFEILTGRPVDQLGS